MADASALLELAGPFGAVGPPRRADTGGWLPEECSVFTSFTGNPTAVAGPFRPRARTAYGAGRAYGDPDRARLLAVAEALERYAALLVDGKRLIVAAAAELGRDALDLDRVPRCSRRELSRPGCPVVNADKTRPIRWTPAEDLHTGTRVLVPAVMAFLEFPELEAENFWVPISTGCAVHGSFEAAAVAAICEVIERDAIALTWLQRLPLPRLDDRCLSAAARSLIAWCSDRGIASHLYDATTDLGVPMVYCLQTTDRTPRGAQLVGAACGFDVPSLAEHALLETMALRLGVQARRGLPRRYADFRSIHDDAAVMAARSKRAAFGFLLDDLANRPVSRPRDPGQGSDRERLRFLLQRLSRAGMTAWVVDLTPRELREVGHVALRVIIPELQPMSARPLVQYRGHPRLYSAPGRMGFRALPERRLNPYPQPMA
ncbi:bacteriocin biosynthesis protein SagD [Nonomuraea phyllanthi]|uniref:Bacteriocin biosynthesis protein SagD n=1 Tax=Nonomuraea phyllanthi TaxID=2219224 RepID=A0A5C4WI88_9ACTN|nr:YcaO-like family protein [Nonomuraea phyllanthi]KAB8194174.1 bacteriocin biosynthesis protein SagD [Nonomuraea phyllanthi]